MTIRNATRAVKYNVTVCVENEGGEKVNASTVIGKPFLQYTLAKTFSEGDCLYFIATLIS